MYKETVEPFECWIFLAKMCRKIRQRKVLVVDANGQSPMFLGNLVFSSHSWFALCNFES